MLAPRYYGRELSGKELSVYGALRDMGHGRTHDVAGVDVTRGNFGPWFYVTTGCGRIELSGATEGAVYVAALSDAR